MKNPVILSIALVVALSPVASGQISSPLTLKLPEGEAELGITGSSTGTNFKWLPAKNAKEAAAIWTDGDRFTFLNMASISGTSSGGTASVDVIADFLGPMRVALVGNVSSSDSDSTDEEKRERFLSGGGSAVLSGVLLGPSLSWGTGGYLVTSFIPKVGFDFPALGSTTTTSTANANFALELKVNIPLAQNKLGFFGNIRGSYTTAGEEFYVQIGSPENKPFTYSILNAGITIPELKVAVLFTRVLSGPDFISSYNGNGRISLVISPK